MILGVRDIAQWQSICLICERPKVWNKIVKKEKRVFLMKWNGNRWNHRKHENIFYNFYYIETINRHMHLCLNYDLNFFLLETVINKTPSFIFPFIENRFFSHIVNCSLFLRINTCKQWNNTIPSFFLPSILCIPTCSLLAWH